MDGRQLFLNGFQHNMAYVLSSAHKGYSGNYCAVPIFDHGPATQSSSIQCNSPSAANILTGSLLTSARHWYNPVVKGNNTVHMCMPMNLCMPPLQTVPSQHITNKLHGPHCHVPHKSLSMPSWWCISSADHNCSDACYCRPTCHRRTGWGLPWPKNFTPKSAILCSRVKRCRQLRVLSSSMPHICRDTNMACVVLTYLGMQGQLNTAASTN